MALHFMQHTKAPLSFTPSAARLTALSRGHVYASARTYRFASSSSSFLSRVLRKLSAPFQSLQHHGQRSRVRSPVSFFKFGTASEKIKLPDVVEAGDPVLHEPASLVPVHDICSHRIQKIIDDMVAVMRAAPGVGLAAPQIGIPLQIIVLEDTQEYISYASKQESDSQHRIPFDLLVICNPSLKSKGNKKALFFEACLSIAGYNGLVERHLEVEVVGYGRDGLPLKVEAYGWKARILQHECDHLNGVLYVDKLIPRTFRADKNSSFPLAASCPKPGVCRGRVRPGNLAIEEKNRKREF